MGKAAPAAPTVTVIEKPISFARLHGKACIDCGAVHRALRPVGSVTLLGGGGGGGGGGGCVWPVVTCGCREAK